MTRDEFRKRMQIDRFLQQRGVTVCPPDAGPDPPAVAARRGANRRRKLTNFAQRMTHHPQDDDGAPVPFRKNRGF